MPTNVYRTNAAIVCKDFDLLQQCADQKGMQWSLLPVGSTEKFLAELVAASGQGSWVACDALEVGVELLREAVHAVWLKTPWNHHADFRFWVIDGPLREVTIASNKREQEMLPFILSRSAMFLTYTSQFIDEFDARELVSAVEDSNLAAVIRSNLFINHLQPHDIVMLFHRCKKEEIFVAICKDGNVTEESVQRILQARSMEGKSALDVAIEKDYRKAATLLRDLGCKSEEFDFELLLDANFIPMLNLLLDPWKQFPFDPKEAAAKIAKANRGSILKQLFNSRVDVNFGGDDYPLAEACATENMDLLHIVLDRMSATGVHPCSDYRLATLFINKILTVDFLNRGVRQVTRRRSAANFGEASTYQEDEDIPLTPEQLIAVPIPEVTLSILLKLARAVTGDEMKVGYNVNAIRRASAYPDLIHEMLQSVDVHKADNPEDLLRFFIQFDPSNEDAQEITRIGLEKVGQSGAPDVDDRTFDFIAQMLRVGPSAVPMSRTALQLAVARNYVPLTYRRKPGSPSGPVRPSSTNNSKHRTGSTVAIITEGPEEAASTTTQQAAYSPPWTTATPNDTKTLLMLAVEYPPNVPGLLAILEVCTEYNKDKVVNQVDDAQCNVLMRLVAELAQSPNPEVRGEFLNQYGDCVMHLLRTGCDFNVSPPSFSVPLFTFAARQDLGEVCYELLETRPIKETSLVLSGTANLHALMVNRYLRLLAPLIQEATPKLVNSRAGKQQGAASASSGADESKQTAASVKLAINAKGKFKARGEEQKAKEERREQEEAAPNAESKHVAGGLAGGLENTTTLSIKSAKGLLQLDGAFTGKSDPFVKVFQGGEQIHRTKTVDDKLNPVWAQGTESVKIQSDTAVYLEVWEDDNFSGNDFMGCVTLDPTQLKASGNLEVSLSCRDAEECEVVLQADSLGILCLVLEVTGAEATPADQTPEGEAAAPEQSALAPKEQKKKKKEQDAKSSSSPTTTVNPTTVAAAQLVPVDKRINPPPNYVAGEYIRTVISEFSLLLLGEIATWLPFADKPSLLACNATWYYAGMADQVWVQLVEPSEEENAPSPIARPTYTRSAWACKKAAKLAAK